MRKVLAPLVVLGFVLGAISIASAATPGVSKDDIKLGVTYVDLDAIRDVTDISHGDYKTTYNAVIDELNKKGGINGRKVVPVFAPINPIGTAPAQEACVKLTEDEKVFAAVGFFYFDGPLCYVAQHDTPILGGTMNPTYLQQAKAPWMTLDSGPEVTPRAVDALVKSGDLKGKIGIVGVATEEKNLLDAAVLPALKRNGIKNTVAIIDAPLNDTVAATQQAGTIAEKFKSEGIKTVLLVGAAPSAFSNALKNTDYRPKLVGTPFSTFQGAAINKATDPALWKGSATADIAADFNDPSLQTVLRHGREGHREDDRRAPGARDARLPSVGARRVPVHLPLLSACGRGRQGPHRRRLREGCGEARLGDDPGAGDDQVRPEDPHLGPAAVDVQVRPHHAGPGAGQEDRLTWTRRPPRPPRPARRRNSP